MSGAPVSSRATTSLRDGARATHCGMIATPTFAATSATASSPIPSRISTGRTVSSARSPPTGSRDAGSASHGLLEEVAREGRGEPLGQSLQGVGSGVGREALDLGLDRGIAGLDRAAQVGERLVVVHAAVEVDHRAVGLRHARGDRFEPLGDVRGGPFADDGGDPVPRPLQALDAARELGIDLVQGLALGGGAAEVELPARRPWGSA